MIVKNQMILSLLILSILMGCKSQKNLSVVQNQDVIEADTIVASTKEPLPTLDTTLLNDLLIQQLEDSSADLKTKYGLHVVGEDLKLYSDNNNELLWLDDSARNQAITLLKISWRQGLKPEDYHYEKIAELEEKGTSKTSEEYVQEDLLVTDGVMLYFYHMLEGKVDPHQLDSDWNYSSRPIPENEDSLIYELIKSDDLIEGAKKLEPSFSFYKEYKYWLVYYTLLKHNNHAWKTIQYPGKALRLGDSAQVVLDIKKRLINYGDHQHYESTPVFDEQLEAVIKEFQKHHGIEADGIMGKSTFEKLNISVDECINTIRVNMERMRWLDKNQPDRYLLVNIADYKLYVFEGDQIVYRSKVVVGKEHHESPVFGSKIRYIEFNPTWTVPHSIATKEILPKLKTIPDYLPTRNMVILKGGKPIDPNSIDFQKYSEHNFPFTLRQEPGPNNALGTMKFIFPNKHAVYLHDTPSKYAFNQTERAFSHGCIRVHQPAKLAKFLLAYQNFSGSQVDKILASKKTTQITLKPYFPVMIMYWTCYQDKSNEIMYFYKDLYGRDAKVLKALNTPLH